MEIAIVKMTRNLNRFIVKIDGVLKMCYRLLGYTLWIILIFIQFPMGGFANQLDMVPVQYFETAEEISTKKVSVAFGNSTYEIPINYVIGVRQPKYSGAYAQFELLFLFPDLTPRNEDNRTEFQTPGGGDAVRVNVEFGIHSDAPDIVIKRIIHLQKGLENNYTITKSGYKLYKFDDYSAFPEVYVKNTGGNDIFYFICGTNDRFPYPRCTVLMNIDSETHIQYYFPRKFIDIAYDEHLKIIALIKSFSEN
jgi:hypothetical protein